MGDCLTRHERTSVKAAPAFGPGPRSLVSSGCTGSPRDLLTLVGDSAAAFGPVCKRFPTSTARTVPMPLETLHFITMLLS